MTTKVLRNSFQFVLGPTSCTVTKLDGGTRDITPILVIKQTTGHPKQVCHGRWNSRSLTHAPLLNEQERTTLERMLRQA